jgi:alpha-L-fucosidase 2
MITGLETQFLGKNAQWKQSLSTFRQLYKRSPLPQLIRYLSPISNRWKFGATSGMTEMLMQSQDRDKEGRYIIDNLPALPSSWPTGSVKGLIARGNHKVDIQWQQGQLKSLYVTSISGHSFALRIPGEKELRIFNPKIDETVMFHP